MANKQDFIIDKGADFIRTIYMRDENDAAIDLTGVAQVYNKTANTFSVQTQRTD